MAGGALPVSAIAGKRDLMKLYQARKVVHGGTFNGFPLGMAAVKATLQILAQDGGHHYELMSARMRQIHRAFLAAAARHGIELEMKGVDSAGVYHVLTPWRGSFAQYAVRFINSAMAENGILVSNLNRFYGSVAVSDADVALFNERIEPVFEAVTSRFKTNAAA